MSTLDIAGFDEVELEGSLTVKQLRFVNEYLIDSNGTQAAIRAGYSPDSANEQGSRLLAKVKVKAAIRERLEHAAAAASVSAERIVAEFESIAFADASELQELIVRPCARCWPKGLTLADPNPLCDTPIIVEVGNPGGCGGAGIMIVKTTPTAKLSRRAAKLISAIRQKKDGTVEIEMRSQDKALEALGRVKGIFKDVRELSGPNGGPVPLAAYQPGKARELSNADLEAMIASIAAARGISEGTSQVIEGNTHELKGLHDGSSPYVPVTAVSRDTSDTE